MPSASTMSADVSSTATESSLLLRARQVSVAEKNSKLMVGGRWAATAGGGRPLSKRRIVPWIGSRQLHGRGESIRFGGRGGYRAGRRRGGGPARRRERAQVGGELAA